MYEERVRSAALRKKIMSAEEAAAKIQPGMVLGVSGFTGMGYPKAVPIAIAKRGAAKDLTIISGASTGDELDGELARAHMIRRRYSFQTSKFTRNGINHGEILYRDLHLGAVTQYLYSKRCGKLDYGIIECCLIQEDGFVPTLSVGASEAMVNMCDHLILEVNTNIPLELAGIHDIFSCGPVPTSVTPDIRRASDRIGRPFIPIRPEQVEAIVITDLPAKHIIFSQPDAISDAIAKNIIQLIRSDVQAGRLPERFTFQSGQGSVANAVLAGLQESGFRDLEMFTEVIQDKGLNLIERGVVSSASATALSLTDQGFKLLLEKLNFFKEHIVLRPQEISNSAALIHNMGVVAMNTAVEADLYGHVNSTNVMGSAMVNGIGGSNDFAKNGGLRIFMTPSTAKNGAISCIVPMATHVDTTEHDVDILVTEYGYADLRGKAPREIAAEIIAHCAHPDYRPLLRDYLRDAEAHCAGMHMPHLLSRAFEMHIRYQETGSMK